MRQCSVRTSVPKWIIMEHQTPLRYFTEYGIHPRSDSLKQCCIINFVDLFLEMIVALCYQVTWNVSSIIFFTGHQLSQFVSLEYLPVVFDVPLPKLYIKKLYIALDLLSSRCDIDIGLVTQCCAKIEPEQKKIKQQRLFIALSMLTPKRHAIFHYMAQAS